LYTADLKPGTDWGNLLISLGIGTIRPVAGYIIGQINGPSSNVAVLDDEIRELVREYKSTPNPLLRAEVLDKIEVLQELRKKIVGSTLAIEVPPLL
jgi:hypothetical protein